MGKLGCLKKELSVFHENCCGFGPSKVKKSGKTKTSLGWAGLSSTQAEIGL